MAIGWASDKSLGATATVVGVAGGAVALGAWSTADSLTKVFVFASVFGEHPLHLSVDVLAHSLFFI